MIERQVVTSSTLRLIASDIVTSPALSSIHTKLLPVKRHRVQGEELEALELWTQVCYDDKSGVILDTIDATNVSAERDGLT